MAAYRYAKRIWLDCPHASFIDSIAGQKCIHAWFWRDDFEIVLARADPSLNSPVVLFKLDARLPTTDFYFVFHNWDVTFSARRGRRASSGSLWRQQKPLALCRLLSCAKSS